MRFIIHDVWILCGENNPKIRCDKLKKNPCEKEVCYFECALVEYFKLKN